MIEKQKTILYYETPDLVMKVPRFFLLVSKLPSIWEPDNFVLTGSATLAVTGYRDVGDLDVLRQSTHFSDVESLKKEGIGVFFKEKRLGLSFHDVQETASRLRLSDGRELYVQSPRITLATKLMVTPYPRPKDLLDMNALVALVHEEARMLGRGV